MEVNQNSFCRWDFYIEYEIEPTTYFDEEKAFPVSLCFSLLPMEHIRALQWKMAVLLATHTGPKNSPQKLNPVILMSFSVAFLLGKVLVENVLSCVEEWVLWFGRQFWDPSLLGSLAREEVITTELSKRRC